MLYIHKIISMHVVGYAAVGGLVFPWGDTGVVAGYFWCRGFYVDTVGKNTAAIKKYIQNQLKEDLEYD